MLHQLSLAIVPDVSDWGRVGFLCMYGTLGMLFFSTVRAAGSNPGVGIASCVVFLIAMTQGQFVRPARASWGHVSPQSHPPPLLQTSSAMHIENTQVNSTRHVSAVLGLHEVSEWWMEVETMLEE